MSKVKNLDTGEMESVGNKKGVTTANPNVGGAFSSARADTDFEVPYSAIFFAEYRMNRKSSQFSHELLYSYNEMDTGSSSGNLVINKSYVDEFNQWVETEDYQFNGLLIETEIS